MSESTHESSAQIRVLLVDDQEGPREERAHWLRRTAGFQIDTAGSGEEALEKVHQAEGGYDVAVMDQKLDGMSGIETMMRLKADYPDLPVVIFTGQEPGAGVDALRKGAYHYLLKPFDPEELVIIIREAAKLKELPRRTAEAKWLQATLHAVQELSALPLTAMPGEIVEAVNKQIAEKVVRAVHSLTQDDVAFWLPDKTGAQWKIWGYVGLDAAYVEKARFSLEDSVSGAALRAGEITEVYDIFDPHREPRFKYQEQALKAGWKSELIVPLRAQGHVLGTISVYSKVQRSFPQWERNLLSTIGNQAAVSLVQSQLRKKETVLREVGRSLVSSVPLQLEQVLPAIVQGALRLTGTESGVVHVIDETGTRIVASHGYPEVFERPQRMREEGNTRWIVKNQKRVIHDNVHTAPRPINPAVLTRDVKAFVGEPLMLENKHVVGVLYVNDKSPRQFSESELQLLESLGNQAAIAVENARLYSELQNRIRTLSDLNEAGKVLTAAADLPSVLTGVVERATAILEADAVVVYCYDRERDDVVLPPVYTGVRQPEILQVGVYSKDSVSMHLIRSEKSRYAPNSKEDDILSGQPRPAEAAQAFVEREDIVSSAGVLLKVMGEIVGVLFVNYRNPHNFDEQEREKIELFARQAAVSIQHALRLEQATQRAQALELLHNVSEKISSALDPDESLMLIVNGAMQLTKMDSGVIHLVDETGRSVVRSLELPTGFHHPTPRLSQRNSMTRTIIDSGKLKAVPDIENEPLVNQVMWKDKGVKSLIGLPLKLAESITGVLYLNSTQPRWFPKQEQSLLLALASQAAIVIRNASLLKERDERAARLEQLHRIAASVSAKAIGLEDVSQLIVESLSNTVLPEASCAIRLYNPKTDEFALQKATGLLKDLIERPPRSDGTSRYVVRKKVPLYIEDTSASPPAGVPCVRQEFLERGVKAIAYLPLISEGDVVTGIVTGILYVNLFSPHQFSQNDKLILELFAHQAAVTIERERQSDQLRALSQLGGDLADLES